MMSHPGIHGIHVSVQENRPSVGSGEPSLLSSFIWVDVSLGVVAVHDVMVEKPHDLQLVLALVSRLSYLLNDELRQQVDLTR